MLGQDPEISVLARSDRQVMRDVSIPVREGE
jgi:hypothetical protein